MPKPDLFPLLLLLACGLAWGFVGYTCPPFDFDLGWHLLGGRYVVENGSVPRADFINAFNGEWHDYHWLAQVVMWRIFEWGGFKAIPIAHGLVMAGIGAALAANCWRLFNKSVFGLLALCWACLLIQEVGSPRPQLAALMIIAMMQWIVLSATKAELLWMFAATALLANVHVYWIVLPGLWGIYRCLPRLLGDSRYSAMYAWGGLLVLLLAPLLSPYGIFQQPGDSLEYFRNYFVLMEYSVLPQVIKETVNEFRGGFAVPTITAWILIVSTVVIGWGLRMRWEKKDLPALIAMGLTLVASAYSVKYVALLAILSLPFWAIVFLNPSKVVLWGERNSFWIGSVCSLLFLAGIVMRFPGSHEWRNAPLASIDSQAPFSLCTKLASLPITSSDSTRPVRILTHFNHGGWCKFALTLANPALDWRVTTDNRTQNTPGEHYQLSFDLFGVRGAWIDTLSRWGPDAVVTNKRFPLASFMALAPQRWQMVLQDDNFAVFIPRTVNAIVPKD